MFLPSGEDCIPRSGQCQRSVEATRLSLLGEDCVPCSRNTAFPARDVRVALSKGLDSGVSRVATRLIEGASLGRVGHIHSGGCGCLNF